MILLGETILLRKQLCVVRSGYWARFVSEQTFQAEPDNISPNLY